MKRYCIVFSYDGSNFCGYQIQPGLRTVQGELEEAVAYINNQQKTNVQASGRTDKGVHAINQVAHFDLTVDITEAKLKRALNSNLPEDIHVIKALEVSSDFHARYMVSSKEYQYKINLGEYQPILRNYVYQCCHKLDIAKMKKALSYLRGTHDFRAFVSENRERENCVRTITKVKMIQSKEYPDQYEIHFKGDGFLKYQVRNMVGILIKIGEGKKEPEDVLKILESKDRTKAGSTAPAEGLYLVDVEYKAKKNLL